MVQSKSYLICTDKTSVVGVMCIKVVGPYKKKIANLGELLIVCVHKVNLKRYVNLKARFQKRFRIGALHRALLIRSKVNFSRARGAYIKFNQNNCIIVGKNFVPLSNKVFGPVLREFCIKWPSLGCAATCII